jgi:hypothetical protein
MDDQPVGIMNGLQSGVFLSPRAAGIGRLPDNAHAAEGAGFDFISAQDHPYVPDFLDTFALIGALIGQTDRIRFMTNVANLPLRPPQMLAKAAASLDLLSGGRFELGLGAGRAWPQIAGLGGPQRGRRAPCPVASRPHRQPARPLLPRAGRGRSRAGAPHRHLARRHRTADARPGRRQGRWLDRPAGHRV